jgi:putative two-component system response regulator
MSSTQAVLAKPDSSAQSAENTLRSDPYSARVMIVDDDSVSVKVVRRYLEKTGYNDFVTTNDATRAMPLLAAHDPHVVLLDIMMPGMDGFEILDLIRREYDNLELPVIVLTGSDDPETKLRALEIGATDILNKPVDPSELTVRVRNAIMIRAAHQQQVEYAHDLERTVRLRTAELYKSHEELVLSLARAAEFRDDDTGRHVVRVGRYVRSICLELGMSADDATVYEQASQMHDVGKIGIPDRILLKPGKLDSYEFEQIKKHPEYGQHIFKNLPDDERNVLRKHSEYGAQILNVSSSPVIQLAHEIAISHHEKWNGQGYPFGLSGEDIPLGGRITAVADVFDALSSERPYKRAFPLEKCFAILDDERGRHFDPAMVDAFFGRRDEVVQTRTECADA